MKNINKLSDLVGLTLTAVTDVEQYDEEITFEFDDGNKLVMYHEQDCCESVGVEDVDGDIQDLVGGVVVEFEEVSSEGVPEPETEYLESYTWTFYKVATTKGFVNIRWLGESNGYYSESVDLMVTCPEGQEPKYRGYGVPKGYKSI